jgi:hypothetical protein
VQETTASFTKIATRQAAGLLNSWKEIASFLDRGVRTVQRWEREQNLPVHRVGSGERSPVFAFPAELLIWVRTVDMQMGPSAPSGRESHNPAVRRSRQLVSESLALIKSIATTFAKQRQRTEEMCKKLSTLHLLAERTRTESKCNPGASGNLHQQSNGEFLPVHEKITKGALRWQEIRII